MSKHQWKYDGLDSHKGEYWYVCTRCGKKDWVARVGSERDLAQAGCIATPAPVATAAPVATSSDITKLAQVLKEYQEAEAACKEAHRAWESAKAKLKELCNHPATVHKVEPHHDEYGKLLGRTGYDECYFCKARLNERGV